MKGSQGIIGFLINGFQTFLKMESTYFLVLGPSRSSARLGFGSSLWAKELCLARFVSPYLAKKLGSTQLAP